MRALFGCGCFFFFLPRLMFALDWKCERRGREGRRGWEEEGEWGKTEWRGSERERQRITRERGREKRKTKENGKEGRALKESLRHKIKIPRQKVYHLQVWQFVITLTNLCEMCLYVFAVQIIVKSSLKTWYKRHTSYYYLIRKRYFFKHTHKTKIPRNFQTKVHPGLMWLRFGDVYCAYALWCHGLCLTGVENFDLKYENIFISRLCNDTQKKQDAEEKFKINED